MTTPTTPDATLSQRALIGALLQEYDRVFPILESAGITAESFTDATCIQTWKAVAKLRTAGKIVDLVTVSEAFDGDAADAMQALGELVGVCPAPAHAAHYAQEVRDAQRWRDAGAAAKDAVVELSKPRYRDPRDILSEIIDPQLADKGGFEASGISSLREFMQERVPEPPQVIRNVLRSGQVGVLASGSKAGKTWLMQLLGLSVATGRMWLAWKTTPGRVLYIDPELCHFDGQSRMKKLVGALGLNDVPEGIDYWRVKGKRLTISDIERKVKIRMKETGAPYALIIVDSIYCFGDGRDENDNSEQALTMQELYTLSEASGAAVVMSHHFSKGAQNGKAHIDRMSGAGVFARAPDAIITLTPHEEEDCYSVEATVRSFARPDGFVVRWEYPLWRIEQDMDPEALKRPGMGRGSQYTPKQIVDLLPKDGLPHHEWLAKAKAELGCGKSTFNKLLGKAKANGLAFVGFGKYLPGTPTAELPAGLGEEE